LRDALISAGIALGILAAAEVALLSTGFHYEVAPMAFRFGYPDAREIVGVFQPDALLFWRMRPGSVFDAEAPVPINAAGYRGPMPAAAKPFLRVAVMGDSVAFGASTAFPELLAERLGAEVLNFGVPGYSVVQGLRQFDAEVARLRPDVVVIAYGWNDHWLAKNGLTDEARRTRITPVLRLGQALLKLRIGQALRFAVDKHAHRPRPGPGSPARVPIDAFTSHVATLIERARQAGAKPVVVALPSALALGEFPEYLIDMEFTRSAEDAIEAHRRYAEAARKTAAAAGVVFVDLQPAFEGDPALFRKDKIHLTDTGNVKVVDVLSPVIAGLP
jgi:lysophospholipase L1-like esterase